MAIQDSNQIRMEIKAAVKVAPSIDVSLVLHTLWLNA